jgi:acetyltransferase-like isoleucine patch superfamily enzyme
MATEDMKRVINLSSKDKIDFYVSAGARIGRNVRLGTGSLLVGENITIGDNVSIEDAVVLRFVSLNLGSDICIGQGTEISADAISIGDDISIGCGNRIIAPDQFKLGSNTNWGSNCSVTCRSFEAGGFLQFYDRVVVGKGGKFGPNSRVRIGFACFIGAGTLLNVSDSIEIGDHVGIGDECCLWTHGAYLDVLKGFPSKFGPLKIGSNVWIPARTVILPGVGIGSNTVVGINSVVDKDIPEGAFAAGIPARVIRENYYPRSLAQDERRTLIETILKDYRELIEFKKLRTSVEYAAGSDTILLKREGAQEVTEFHLSSMRVEGYEDACSEDLRDYLRRRGIKFFTSRRFKSIVPPLFRKYLEK